MITEVGCWAHARRRFDEAQGSDAARSLTAVAMIRVLYDVEREAQDLTPAQRLQLRQDKSVPQLEKIKAWLNEHSLHALPKSPIGQAISYALGNWEALARYATDGDLSIDNNPAERALRDLVIGRNNWLFAGIDNGGRAAAVLCSFVASCKRHGVDPFEYLRDVFTRLMDCPVKQIDQFLPDRWVKPAPAQPT